MRILIVTQIFPSRARPLAAAFNRQQFAALAALADVEVVTTLPWFPGARMLRGRTRAAQTHEIPRRDTISGVSVRYSPVLHLPKLHGVAAFTCAASLAPALAAERGRVDAILGSWAYPEGAASVLLARMLDAPCVVKIHGSDLNRIANLTGPRAVLRWLLPRADGVVAVSRALAERAAAIGIDRDRIDVIKNGVDERLFHVRDRREARLRLGLEGEEPLLLFVGSLLESKGVFDLLEAWPEVAARREGARLVLVGEGPARGELERRAARLPRVDLAGGRPLEEVADWMAACDALTLPSWSEGTPNVVLEALASGRRVVATAVGGIPDLLEDERLGRTVAPRDPIALAERLSEVLGSPYDPGEVARLGGPGDWHESARELLSAIERAVARRVD